MNAKYYISTGALNCYYTLRYHYDEIVYGPLNDYGSRDSHVVERDYHVRNLSTNREEAIAKAKEQVGINSGADFEVNPITRRSEIDWSVFQAGKYAGKSIHEVREMDTDYLVWVCENLASSPKYTKTVELAKALVESELNALAAARLEKEREREQEKVKLVNAFHDVIDCLKSYPGDFCQSIVSSFESGVLPSERAMWIVSDIYAKSFGRRNSKAYAEASDRFQAIWDDVAPTTP